MRYLDVKYPPDSLPSSGFCQNLPCVLKPYSTPLIGWLAYPFNLNAASSNTAHDTLILGFPVRIRVLLLSDKHNRETEDYWSSWLYTPFIHTQGFPCSYNMQPLVFCTCPNLQTDGIPNPFLIFTYLFLASQIPMLITTQLHSYYIINLGIYTYKHIRSTWMIYQIFQIFL